MRRFFVLAAALSLMASAAVELVRLKSHQRLGAAAVKVRVLPGGGAEVALPEVAGDFTSRPLETPQGVFDLLPKDTTFGHRLYVLPDGFGLQVNAVLMGADRSSIHKPQSCLPAQGLTIERTEVEQVHIFRPHAHELPVVKLTLGNIRVQGRTTPLRGLFVYWFVADGELSADTSGLRRAWRSAWHLLRTGELQRWAYVSCFAVCEPGQEDEVFLRMRQFIAAAVPQLDAASGK